MIESYILEVHMSVLRDKVQGESFDYTTLMETLREYSSPRSKVTQMLRNKEIIRVKKGIYIFGQKYRNSIVSLEILANQIYGPSYVSLEYALSYYGLIPEFVAEITSVTTKRKKEYETPIGRFSYLPIPTHLFSVAFTLEQVAPYGSALLATPEKALADLLYVRKFEVSTSADLESLLFDNLRLGEVMIKNLRIGVLESILKAGGSPVLSQLITWIRSNK